MSIDRCGLNITGVTSFCLCYPLGSAYLEQFPRAHIRSDMCVLNDCVKGYANVFRKLCKSSGQLT